MTIHNIKHALQGYHDEIKDDVKEHIHYSELIRRMAPTWLKQMVDEREYVAAQLRQIETMQNPALMQFIASQTLHTLGEESHYAELHTNRRKAN